MPADPADSSRRCPYCQAIARESALYCRMCGRQLDLLEVPPGAVNGGAVDTLRGLCSACGFMNILGELFCAQCGVQLPPIASLPPPLPNKVES